MQLHRADGLLKLFLAIFKLRLLYLKACMRSRYFVGMNKWGHDASACLIEETGSKPSIEIFLKERITRNKGASGPIDMVLEPIRAKIEPAQSLFGESSYLLRPADYDEHFAARFPEYPEQIKQRGHEIFHTRTNPAIVYLPHHYCHAMGAVAVAPFSSSLIVVMDGAGSCPSSLDEDHPERLRFPPPVDKAPRSVSEWYTVYLQRGASLDCVEKEWQVFGEPLRQGGLAYAPGLGTFYESAALFVFNSTREAGKVMGLAGFGRASPVADRTRFYRELDWNHAYQGESGLRWNKTKHFELYANLAASVQAHFEQQLLERLASLKKRFPSVENLILTGGCALNCVANMKIVKAGLFKNVYVPPFPSDESTSLGVATHLRSSVAELPWAPLSWEEQTGSFGPLASVPKASAIKRAFSGFAIERPSRIEEAVAEMLCDGAVVGWFQGRSESGPRALGNRSVLASPGYAGMKDRLNSVIKGREAFRPYGAACAWEKAHEYFEISRGFDGPFMSFAPQVRAQYRKALSEVLHVDGSSRIQTVRRSQNGRFYDLIEAFGKRTGTHCVLNTSMNVMGEPIVESVEDARRFFELSPIDALAIGDFLIRRQAKRGRASRNRSE